MRSAQATFHLDGPERELEFLRTYMVPAWDRFRAHEAFDCGWFWRFGNAGRHGPVELEGGTTFEDGGVILVLNGSPTPEPLVEQERSRWDDLESRGVLDRWNSQWFHPEYETAREKAVENFGPVGGDWAYRMRPMVSRFTLDLLVEFQEVLPAVGEETEDNPVPVGFWALIHFLMKQHGYDWYDEIDACTKAIENRLRSLAAFHGSDAAREELETVLAALEQVDIEP